MPFAKYKDFDACILDMKKQGKDEETAKKICGKMQAETKSKSKTINFSVPIEIVKELISEATETAPLHIRGTAINETVTRNGHKFIGEELEKATPSLKGKPILKDHNKSVDSIVGKVTESIYSLENNKGKILFDGIIKDAKMKEMINDGLIGSVSVGAVLTKPMVTEEIDGVKTHTVKGIEFVELSLVAIPADPNAGFGLMQAIAEGYEDTDWVDDEKEDKQEEDENMEEVKVNEELTKKLDEAQKVIEAMKLAEKERLVASILEINPELKKEELMDKSDLELNLIKNYEGKIKTASVKVEQKAETKALVDVPKTEETIKKSNIIVEDLNNGKKAYYRGGN